MKYDIVINSSVTLEEGLASVYDGIKHKVFDVVTVKICVRKRYVEWVLTFLELYKKNINFNSGVGVNFFIDVSADYAVKDTKIINLLKMHPCVRLTIEAIVEEDLLKLFYLEADVRNKVIVRLVYTSFNVLKLFENLVILYKNRFKNFELMHSGHIWGDQELSCLGSELSKIGALFITELIHKKKINILNFKKDYNDFILFPVDLKNLEFGFKRNISLQLAKFWLNCKIVGTDKEYKFIKEFVGVEDDI